jgi:hypothetical protein
LTPRWEDCASPIAEQVVRLIVEELADQLDEIRQTAWHKTIRAGAAVSAPDHNRYQDQQRIHQQQRSHGVGEVKAGQDVARSTSAGSEMTGSATPAPIEGKKVKGSHTHTTATKPMMAAKTSKPRSGALIASSLL